MTSKPVLSVRNLSKRFGGLQAVDDVSFDLNVGEIVGLIGPNGAGKTTLVNLLTGAFRATSGAIHFEDNDVTVQQPHQAARRGIARTFQIVQPFPEMTVVENVALAALFARGLSSIKEANEAALAELEFVGLAPRAETLASSLTLPDRKRLELAKSLAMAPKVLLLDEVNAGLNTREIDAALELIRSIAARGITILVIEHLMKVIFSLSSRILVLHHGQLIASGNPRDVIEDRQVIAAYLGSKFAENHGPLQMDGSAHE